MKILLLEDNVSFAEIIKEMLESKGYIVDFFIDGEDVLTNCTNGYDCFLLDINVPNIDGLTLLKEIRKLYTDTPAIIISSNIELETVKEAYIAGCTDYLKKPFYIYELEQKINMLCKRDIIINLLCSYTYDFNREILFDETNNEVKLTYKERLFMTLLLKSTNRITSLTTIEQYVWEGEESTTTSIRSLVKRLRYKLPKETIITENYGYSISIKKEE